MSEAPAPEFVAVHYGEQEFTVPLVRSARRTLQLTVYPDGSLLARVPSQAPLETVAVRVQRRASWIARQLEEQRRYEPRTPPRRYVRGESHRYLGRQFMLKIEQGETNSVRLQRPHLVVTTKDAPSPERIRTLLDAWYRERAKHTIAQRWERCLADAARYCIEARGYQLRTMPARWGSCPPSGRSNLNPELVKAPVECIDYVILHELSHLRHPNHSRQFFTLLTSLCPDWPRQRERLNAQDGR